MTEYRIHSSAAQLDARGRTHDIEQLLRQHDRLVHAVIRRQGSGMLTYEEALQAGRIGLWRALLGYDPQRGTAFSTYAWIAIRRHIRRAGAQASGELAGGLIPGPQRQGPDPEQYADRLWVHEALCTLLSRLPARLRGILLARYGLDGHPPRSLRRLGAQLGLSHERVRQLEQEALAWLRHPAHSLPLRRRLGTNTVAEYRRALARNVALRRARRRRST